MSAPAAVATVCGVLGLILMIGGRRIQLRLDYDGLGEASMILGFVVFVFALGVLCGWLL